MTTHKWRRAIVVAALVAGAILALTLFRTAEPAGSIGIGETQRLPDGSTLMLRQVLATATNYNFSYRTGNRLVRFLAPILPNAIRNRFPSAGGSFGFGVDGNTNLLVITINRRPGATSGGSSPPLRLRVSDDQGNNYDACWGAHTLGMMGETVNGWQVRGFPRRGRTLGLQFLPADGSWTNVIFHVPNPLYADHPQWTPEPWPIAKKDGNLAVTLKEFQSGARMQGRAGRGNASTAARKTRLVFTFAGDERPSDDWLVQKVTISDATGNRWFPYLSFVKQDFNWVTNGTVEFFGALWPGEDAWKLQVEVIRTRGFQDDALWQLPLALPAPGTVATLTNLWEHDGMTVNLVALASPETEHSGDFKWTAKWWGEDKGKVYSLALSIGPKLEGRRLSVVRAVDQAGRDVKIVEHGSRDSRKQAVFFKPGDEATSLKLTLGLQRSRFVEFLARPEFVNYNDSPKTPAKETGGSTSLH